MKRRILALLFSGLMLFSFPLSVSATDYSAEDYSNVEERWIPCCCPSILTFTLLSGQPICRWQQPFGRHCVSESHSYSARCPVCSKIVTRTVTRPGCGELIR